MAWGASKAKAENGAGLRIVRASGGQREEEANKSKNNAQEYQRDATLSTGMERR